MSKVSYTGDGSDQRIAARRFASFLSTVSGTISKAAEGQDTNLDLIDWDSILLSFEAKYGDLMMELGLDEEDEELDVIDGEEIDTELHPLDPANGDDEDDSWHEGFDDV